MKKIKPIYFCLSILLLSSLNVYSQTIRRSFIKGGNESFTVLLKVMKYDLEGNAQIVEELPDGYIAKVDREDGASFSYAQNENKVHFTWTELPAKRALLISYTVFKIKDEILDSTITGRFLYNEEGLNKTYRIPTSKINVKLNLKKEYLVSLVKESKRVYYTVQIASGSYRISRNYFKKLYHIDDDSVKTEQIGGLTKYLMGEFSNYEDAVKFKTFLRTEHGVFGPFVVAYLDGKRINVPEAIRLQNGIATNRKRLQTVERSK